LNSNKAGKRFKYEKKITVLYHKWTDLKPLNFIIITTLLMLILTVPIGIIFEIINISDHEYGGVDFDKYGVFGLIFLALILAPILETLLSQQIPILLSQRFIKHSPNIIGITISTLIFSWMHLGYSIWYAIGVIPAGFVLANTYIVFQDRKESSFWMTSFLHSFRNLIPVILVLIDRFIK